MQSDFMSKLTAILGWLLLVVLVVAAIVRSGPDDPVTATLKHQGIYWQVVSGMIVILVLLLAYLITAMRRTVRLKAELWRLNYVISQEKKH